MTAAQRAYVVSYDIADDTRRDRLARLLEAHGNRVQRSVFEVLETAEGIARLLEQATATECFNPQTDSLRCYPLCADCRCGTTVFGRAPTPAAPGRPIIL